ncbi:MAG: PVC-type heme-binding CxxCH protein [Planctomycetales bacterium]
MRLSMFRATAVVLAGAMLLAISVGQDSAPSPRQYQSPLVTADPPGHAVAVDLDVTGAKKLFLVVGDGGNGHACDWADWVEPRLVGPNGETKLTDLKWKSAASGWKDVNVGRNCEGGELRVDGKPVKYGIGTHANSVIEYDLPAGVTRFQATGALDDGGTTQSGSTTSVEFAVYLDELPLALAGERGGVSPPVGSSGRAVDQATGRLTPAARRELDNAVAGLDVADGLEATLFAGEPMLLNPTNIDIDHRGRVWVCEVVNYRGRNGTRPEGDRILILEDTDGDGQADKRTVYYQGRDVDSAMGVCVLGNKVIVSCSPNVFVFTDEDGDDKPDKKEVLFTKTGLPQHDHSAHAIVFGPDGKLYWNFGNTGQSVHDKHGKLVVDRAGNEVVDNGKPYRGGMVFRCDLDGSNFEVLGHNFRNNYEVAVDSFGNIWQSDNDDDGNRGVRINFVMEYGNYGYLDEKTGAGWRSPRTNLEEDIPSRHWHQNDPGVVPNLLHTGAGSPCGICVYEGTLLPEVFRGQIIHADAGPRVVRAYPVKKAGAGFTAEMVPILTGTRDDWFRPVDVCVAPDGSLFVADWYDPGVGGHAMGDTERGRIFRVAPPGTAYKAPKYDFTTVDGAIEALASPNLATRYLAWEALAQKIEEADFRLLQVFRDRELNPRLRARALWLLAMQGAIPFGYEKLEVFQDQPDLRTVAIRALKNSISTADANDPSPEIRREMALAIRRILGDVAESPNHKAKADQIAAQSWAKLALSHDGKDRWYLEALGIAADGRWDACLDVWLESVGEDWKTSAGRDIIWRSRAAKTPEYLAKIIASEMANPDALPRYLRAFDFQDPAAAQPVLAQLAFATPDGPREAREFVSREALRRLRNVDFDNHPEHRAALERMLEASKGSRQFIELVSKFNVRERHPDLLALAREKPEEQLGIDAFRALLAATATKLLTDALADDDEQAALAVAAALARSGDAKAAALLEPLAFDAKRPVALRREAVRGLAATRDGASKLLAKAEAKSLDAALVPAAAAVLHASADKSIRARAEKLFPVAPAKDARPLPPIGELVQRKGDRTRGMIVYTTNGTCLNCHKVAQKGKEVGPDLSGIGTKLSRQALYESILFPSAGISHNYETYTILLANGTTASGVITSRTDDAVTLKSADALERTYPAAEIEEIVKQDVSLMPADVQKSMTADELVDLVEYLTTLRSKGPAAKDESRQAEGR